MRFINNAHSAGSDKVDDFESTRQNLSRLKLNSLRHFVRQPSQGRSREEARCLPELPQKSLNFAANLSVGAVFGEETGYLVGRKFLGRLEQGLNCFPFGSLRFHRRL